MKKYINYLVLILLYITLPFAVINAYTYKGLYIPLMLTIYNIFNEK